jgi:hypothetical protein
VIDYTRRVQILSLFTNVLEGVFSEVRSVLAKTVPKQVHLGDALLLARGVSCNSYVARGRHVKAQDRYLPSF